MLKPRLYGRTYSLERDVHWRSGIDLQRLLDSNGVKYKVQPSDLQFKIIELNVNPDGTVQSKFRFSGVHISS